MDPGHQIMLHDVELLAVSTACLQDEGRLILTLRLDPTGDFESINLGLSARQARRLFADLEERLRNSKVLKQSTVQDGTERAAYDAIMFDGPPAKGEDVRDS